jgi:7,8-dihydropterin-6-yl-methyl-4-(beta-D-ribofuranosyl)aminobenzene 5'-phosphate synthase
LLIKMDQIKNLKITTLVENLAFPKYLGQWGLSFLLELVDAKDKLRKIIFDTGGNKKAFKHNVRALKVDLSDVDSVVLSHGHWDHAAATVEVAKAAGGGLKIFAHPHTFLPRFFTDKKGKKQKMGVPKGERLDEIEMEGGKVSLTSEPTEVAPGVWTTGQIKRINAFEQALPLAEGEKLSILIDGMELDDQILDDQAIWTSVENVGPVVITGCAHAGSVNTLFHVQKLGKFKKIFGLVGGTHLVKRSDEYLWKTVGEFKKIELKLISPCHCTGFKATSILWQTFPGAFVLNYSGRAIKPGERPETDVF